MGNQTPDEGCLSRATIGSRGISLISDQEICPACPDPVGEEHRDEGPLCISDKDSSPACPEPLGHPVLLPYLLTSFPAQPREARGREPSVTLNGLPPSLPDATIWCPMTPANPQPSTASRPRVGIPWRTSHEETNRIKSKLQYYLAAVTAAEGEPVPLSLQLSPKELSAQIKDLDAFVLPGAPSDVNPALYRAPRHEKTHDSDSHREQTDFAILEHAFASRKPVLAICYGCQSLNVSLGGTLYQDIASELHTSIEHSKNGLPPDAADPIHPARIDAGGEIAQLAAISGLANRDGGFDARINTSHHQSVRDLGRGLRVAALAPDGVIEAVEHEQVEHWVVGVQWHPERMAGDALAGALFRALLQATRAAAAHR